MQSMGPFERAIAFGDVSELVKQQDPLKAEQLPEKQNDVLSAKRAWELDKTELKAKSYIGALRRANLHADADAFALENLKVKPKFTISEGF